MILTHPDAKRLTPQGTAGTNVSRDRPRVVTGVGHHKVHKYKLVSSARLHGDAQTR